MTSSSARLSRVVPQFFVGGYTMLEILLVLLVISILMIAIQSPLAQFHKFALTQQTLSDLTMSVQRFQLLLKSELIQAGYGFSRKEKNKKFEIKDQTLFLRADLNRDGDLKDAREQIAYRFDAPKQMLLRKSGKGAYQRFLSGITDLKFAYWPAPPQTSSVLCLKITFLLLDQSETQETVLCPINF